MAHADLAASTEQALDGAPRKQQLIERLRSTQDMQRQAYEELQESLQM